MTKRASESLIAVLIRVGLLLALVIMLMAENAQGQPQAHPNAGATPAGSQGSRSDKAGFPPPTRSEGTRSIQTA